MEIINDDFYQDLKRLEKELKGKGKKIGEVITMGDMMNGTKSSNK